MFNLSNSIADGLVKIFDNHRDKTGLTYDNPGKGVNGGAGGGGSGGAWDSNNSYYWRDRFSR